MSDTLKIDQCPFPFKRRTEKRMFCPCVYLLTLNGVVKYVGSTNRIHERDGDSVRCNYKHDTTWILETGTRGEAYDCESWLIENIPTVHNGLRASRKHQNVPYPPFFVYGNTLNFGAARKESAA